MSKQFPNENKGVPGNFRSRKQQTAKPPRGNRRVEIADLRDFLDSLGLHVTPSIKVNGPAHPTAVLAVDFGAPLVPIRLTNDQAQELTRRIRATTREFYSDDVNIRVSADHSQGVYWSSIS